MHSMPDARGFERACLCFARACPADKGRVRSFRLAAEQVDGVQVGYSLVQRGELLWTGDGMQNQVMQSKVGK